MNSLGHHIIVNYHYVEDPSPEWKGIVPCPVAEFERQVRYLAAHYAIVSVEEVFRAAQEGVAEKKCALTFDDGLKDQYENALPILKRYNTRAIFFPITLTFSNRLPTAQKVHVLLSHLTPEDIVKDFNWYMREFYPDRAQQYHIPVHERLTKKRLHEAPAIANLKEVLIILPEDIKARFLRYALKANKLNEAVFTKKLFMSSDELKEITSAGMAIGGHSHSHYASNVVGEEVLQKDIELSLQLLKKELGEMPTVFSYPHGRYSDAAMGVIENAGFAYAVTIEPRAVKNGDNPRAIPRYDTNHLTRFLDETGERA